MKKDIAPIELTVDELKKLKPILRVTRAGKMIKATDEIIDYTINDQYGCWLIERNPTLTEEQVRKFADDIHFGVLSRNFSFDHFSIEFVREFKEKLYLDEIQEACGFPAEYLDEFIGELPIGRMHKWKTLPSIEFMKEHSADINWKKMSKNKALTSEMIETFFDLLNKEKLSANPALTDELILKYEKDLDWETLAMHGIPSMDIVLKYPEKFFGNSFEYRYTNLPISFLKEHADELNWKLLGEWHSITEEFIEEFHSRIDMYTILSRVCDEPCGPSLHEVIIKYFKEQESQEPVQDINDPVDIFVKEACDKI